MARHPSVWAEAEGALPSNWGSDLIDHIAHPIFVKDREFRFVVLNRAFAEFLAAPRDTLLGRNDYDLSPKEQADFFRAKDIEMFESGKPVHVDEEPHTDRSGKKRWLSTTKVPLFNAQGFATHLVGIISDITELKAENARLEERMAEHTLKLEKAQAELLQRERLAVIGRLVGGLAHQIRNPLAAIINAASLLRRSVGTSPSPEVEDALRVIDEESWAANQIISNLIDHVRQRGAKPNRYALKAIVDAAFVAAKPPSNIKIALDLPDVEVAVDLANVVTALCNVLQNAYDVMPNGGSVRIAGKADTVVRLVVSDSGPGVAPDLAERIFEPLMTTKSSGLGLGLSTARTLIEQQHGTLRLIDPLQGAHFELTLPLAVPPP